MYMYEQDLALNNVQGLICHKTQPTNHNFNSVCLLFSKKVKYSFLWENNKKFVKTFYALYFFFLKSLLFLP